MMPIHRLYIIILALFLAIPSVAQHGRDPKTGERIKYATAKEGLPAYYDETVRALFKQGKWAEGKKILDEGMEDYGDLSSLNELMGEYWAHYKKYDKSRYYLIRSLRDDPGNMHSKSLLMKIEETTGHYSTAIVYCNELLEAYPYEYSLWRKKIQLFREQGDTVEATRLLHRLNAIYPDRAEVKKEMVGDYETKYRRYRASNNIPKQEETLRKLVELTPKDAEFQMALCNLLWRTGRSEEAIDVAGYAATVVKDPFPFIEKKASILGGMTRYGEALAYLRNMQKTHPNAQLTRLLNNLEEEAARAALQNDPYTAYAKLYERTHSAEALTYLLNTSMSRGYLDDALTYIREARRRRGDTENLLLREYEVQRRLGNTKAATAMLEKIHSRWPDNKDVNEDLCSVKLDEVRKMMDFKQYDEAIAILEQLRLYKVDDEMKDAVERRLFTCYVETGKREMAIQQLDNISKDPQMSAQLYEEVMLPYIKTLMSQGRLRNAETEIQKVMDKGYPSADILGMAVNVKMQLKKTDDARSLVDMGRVRFPEDPLFQLKDAQMKAADGDYDTAMEILRPMLDTYIGDTAIIRAYADCCESLALQRMKAKDYQEAERLIDEAMQFYPESQSLILTKSTIYESAKDWDKAIEEYKRYRPTLTQWREYNRHMQSLQRHTMRNELQIDYQTARPSSQDAISSMAQVSYTRECKTNNYTFAVGYAGRDSSTPPNALIESGADVDLSVYEGGTGLFFSGQWEHQWNKRLTTELLAGCANKFFPKLRAELKARYELPKEWTAKGSAAFRRISSSETLTLASLGLGAEKALPIFTLGADMHLYYMTGNDTQLFNGKYFINGSLIAKCYPIEDSHTHLFATASVGNAPETSLIDNLMPVKFDQLNTMLGFGGFYTLNAMIDFGLSGQWYMMSVKPVNNHIDDTNKNYLYMNANITIHF